jgi:effector-binding domain-containing protein
MPIQCDFGVEVTRTFETSGEVYATETPGGEAAVAIHHGPYNRLDEAHEAIRKWMAANRRESAGHSWRYTEIRRRIPPAPKRRFCTF